MKTFFGRAERLSTATTLSGPLADSCRTRSGSATSYPQVRVIPPGGPYFKWPWERVYKVSIATQTVNMAFDPEFAAGQPGRTRCWRRSPRTS